MEEAGAGDRFTLLGTSGIGKTLFTYFWICYRASKKEKVVWKIAQDTHYLLDFSEEASSSENPKVARGYGPFTHSDYALLDVFNDPNAWLVIDGKQVGNLTYKCHILLACSARPENYKEFSKNNFVCKKYIPVWAKEEIEGFLDDFERVKSKYSNMVMADRKQVLKNFEKLGGVPRYIFRVDKSETFWAEIERAIGALNKDRYLNLLAGNFDDGDVSDSLVHVTCRGQDYNKPEHVFASLTMRDLLGKHFTTLSKHDVMEFLRAHSQGNLAGNLNRYVFELVVHNVMMRGGEFEMKMVVEGGSVEGVKVDLLKLPARMKVIEFQNAGDLRNVGPRTYCKPNNKNFHNVDAVVSPDIFLQFFSYKAGNHEIMVNGLKDLDDALGLQEYKVCSCVPHDKYDAIGFQNWMTTKNIKCKRKLEVVKKMVQYVVKVDYTKFKD